MHGSNTKPEGPMDAISQARVDHVRTMRDSLSALMKGLGRLPSGPDVHSAQRAARVFDGTLEKIEMKERP